MIPYLVAVALIAVVRKVAKDKVTAQIIKQRTQKKTNECSVQKCPKGKEALKPKIVPCFKKNQKGNPKEYDKQLKDQQNGLNELTAEEYLEGRKAYSSVKRKSTAKDRNKFKERLIEGYRKDDGMSKANATQVAKNKMKTLHALHNPDLIAGGKDKVTTFGDKSVNQSIGSQWKKRVDDLDKAAEKALKEGKGKSKMNAVLTRCK
jgi:hypothetical protein